MILQSPLASMSPLATAAKELENHGARRFPIDASRFWGPRVNELHYEIRLPAGWHAALPKNVTASSPFGSYESSYSEVNGVLRLQRKLTGAIGIQPPERVGELTAWMRAVAADDAKFIVLTRPAATGGGR